VRILVADDDAVTSMFVCAVLRAAGHAPLQAFDAMQTLMVAMRAPQPDAIILDLHMPGGTGQGALKKLKASVKTASIPILILSGNKDAQTRRDVLDGGAMAFLTKPASAESILDALVALR
jgi:two-component system, OmpR family, alkaline phosphatase synthesis response regulator PhoP